MSTPLRERPDAPLGTLIFRAGLLPAETIESALEEGVKTGKRLGEILTERGLISEVDLARLLAGQKGLEFVTLREQIVDPSAASLFTEEQARLFRALPYAYDGELPVVAIADPTDDVLMRNIREALGRDEARFVVCARSELAEIAADVYSRPLMPAPEAAPAPEPEPAPEAEAVPEAEAFPEHPAELEPAHGRDEHANGTSSTDAELVLQAPAYEQAPEPQPAQVAPEPSAFEVPAVEAPTTPEQVAAPEPEQVFAPEPEQPAAEERWPEPAPEPEPQIEIEPPPAAPEPPAALEPPSLPQQAPKPMAAPEPTAALEPTVFPEPGGLTEPDPVPAPAPPLGAEPPVAPPTPQAAPPPAPEQEPAPSPQPAASPEPVPLPLPDPAPPAPTYPPAASLPEPPPSTAPTVPVHDPLPAEHDVPPPDAPEPVATTATAWRLTIRLTNGERVDAGDFPDQGSAKDEAKLIMAQVADADSGDWPFVSGRFLKPDTIVSVDIAELSGDES